MKAGWYKVEYKNHKMADELPLNGEVVFVENDIITEMEDDWGDHKQSVNIAVTDEMKKHMAIMDFAGVA
jgi:hypothetical protein